MQLLHKCSNLASVTSSTRRPYAARVPADVRREQLLDAAIAVIVRDGYAGVSVDAIAREAGVTRPVVYGVFDGLAPLLTALLDRQEARALAQLEEAVSDDASMLTAPDEFLVAAAVRMIDAITSDPHTWRPILLAPSGTPEAVRARIERDREQVRRQIGRLLEVGLAVRGGPKLDVQVMSHALVAVLEHFGRLLLEHPRRFETERLVAAIRGLLRAIGPA
jgi:AcrR family transcriptional regulator